MAKVVLSPIALEDLRQLISTLTLAPTTPARVHSSLRALQLYPRIGAPLTRQWSGYRFVVGPWRWMIIVYEVDDAAEQVGIVTIQDARSAGSPRSHR